MKIATTSKAGATRYAPRFRLASNPLETNVPTKPPAGMAPRMAGMKDRREISAGRERRSNPYPASVATCESIARLRNQRQPRTRIAAGSKNAANPNIWKKRSAPYAPTGPIQFFAAPPSGGGALTLNAASFGLYVSSASAISSATVKHKNPTSSLSRLFPVGVRIRTKSPQLFGEG